MYWNIQCFQRLLYCILRWNITDSSGNKKRVYEEVSNILKSKSTCYWVKALRKGTAQNFNYLFWRQYQSLIFLMEYEFHFGISHTSASEQIHIKWSKNTIMGCFEFFSIPYRYEEHFVKYRNVLFYSTN